MNAYRLGGLVVVVAILVGVSSVRAAPLGTGFTYQGQLKQGGVPVNVPVDLQFSLWDAAVGGGPVGPTETKLNVDVSNGLFTVDLNFGEGVFTGAQRWLQIAVRSPAGVDPYTTLSTRQPLTAAPYSLFSLQAGNTHWATSANHIYSTNAGNVGIGTTSPGRKLQIGDNTVSNSEGMIRLASRSGTQGSNRIWDIGVPETDADSSGFGYSFVIDDTQSGSTPEFMVKFGSGHVGIGTITPASPLHVYKSLSSTAEAALRVDTRYMAGLFAMLATLQIEETSVDAYGSFGDRALHLNPNSSGNVLLGEGGGNVGIDIGTPAVKLHVEGGTDVSPGGGGFLQLGSSTSTNIAIDNNEIMARNNNAAATLALNAAGGDITLIQSGTGDVGIGTSSPSNRLDVQTTTSSGGLRVLQWGTGRAGTFQIINGSTTNAALYVTSTSNNAPAAFIQNSGAGLGLDVAGTTRTFVLQITGGSDLSEGFEVAGEQIVPGTIVVIDPERPGELKPATVAYDRKVAGVVSGAGGVRPGMIMGQEGSPADGKHPVALSGRVYCLADASFGPIEPGDLLTSSDTPGHAMKASDPARAPGAVIGKAMSRLNEGRGLVLVLVNLQ